MYAQRVLCRGLGPNVWVFALQKIAEDLFELLRTVVGAFAQWSADVSSKAADHQQQPASTRQQHDQALKTRAELLETGIWLPVTAQSVLRSRLVHRLWSMVDERQLLDTLGQLLEQVPRQLHAC